MKVGIARIAQETSTFCPTLTDYETMKRSGISLGRDVIDDIQKTPGTLDVFGRQSNLIGFLDVIGVDDCIGIIKAHAQPSGPLTEHATDLLTKLFTEELKKALPLDGLLFDMHGAFAGIKEPDVEGMILKQARTIVGDEVVIGVAMDLHANITQTKIENMDILRGYHTHPHTDARETAQKVAKMLLSTLNGDIKPVVAAVKIPMLTPAHNQLTDVYPMKQLVETTNRQEEGVLSSSFFSVQHLLDIPEVGWSSVVLTDNDPLLAENMAKELADVAWRQRNEYIKPVLGYKKALSKAVNSCLKPVVVADFSDMTTGGGTGDSTWFLKELIALNLKEPCYISMVDPQAVKLIEKKGEGIEISLKLGGKQDNKYSTPAMVTGIIRGIIHPSNGAGDYMQLMMGTTAVLQAGNIHIVISENLGEGATPKIYENAGLNPYKAKIIIAKSVVDFREGYKNVAKLHILGEAPGFCPSNLKKLTWSNIMRPIFPLEDNFEWDSSQAKIYRKSDLRAR